MNNSFLKSFRCLMCKKNIQYSIKNLKVSKVSDFSVTYALKELLSQKSFLQDHTWLQEIPFKWQNPPSLIHVKVTFNFQVKLPRRRMSLFLQENKNSSLVSIKCWKSNSEMFWKLKIVCSSSWVSCEQTTEQVLFPVNAEGRVNRMLLVVVNRMNDRDAGGLDIQDVQDSNNKLGFQWQWFAANWLNVK